MSQKKHYAERDIEQQGAYYAIHVSAMTGEGLHSKSAIAAELAHRDIELARLQNEVTLLTSALDKQNELVQFCLERNIGSIGDDATAVLMTAYDRQADELAKQTERLQGVRKAICLWLRRAAQKGPESAMTRNLLNTAPGHEVWTFAFENAADILEGDWDNFMALADKMNSSHRYITDKEIADIMGDDD